MIGVNVDMLSSIIENVENQIKDSFECLNKLVEISGELSRCYYLESDIQYLFDGMENTERNIKNIKSMLTSYPKILRSVRTSYVKQDEIFSGEINHMISKI